MSTGCTSSISYASLSSCKSLANVAGLQLIYINLSGRILIIFSIVLLSNPFLGGSTKITFGLASKPGGQGRPPLHGYSLPQCPYIAGKKFNIINVIYFCIFFCVGYCIFNNFYSVNFFNVFRNKQWNCSYSTI